MLKFTRKKAKVVDKAKGKRKKEKVSFQGKRHLQGKRKKEKGKSVDKAKGKRSKEKVSFQGKSKKVKGKSRV